MIVVADCFTVKSSSLNINKAELILKHEHLLYWFNERMSMTLCWYKTSEPLKYLLNVM